MAARCFRLSSRRRPRTQHLGHRKGTTEQASYKLIDPDGLFFEAAYDLGILLRNWIDAYQIAEPATALTQRATWLAEQTQVSRQAIVSWGFVEIVSTGIHLLELGYADEGQRLSRPRPNAASGGLKPNDRGPARVDR